MTYKNRILRGLLSIVSLMGTAQAAVTNITTINNSTTINNGNTSTQSSCKESVRKALAYVTSTFPAKIALGSVKTGAGMGLLYGTYLTAKPAMSSYRAASTFSGQENLDAMTKQYALFGARTQYLAYGAVSLGALALGTYICKRGLTDIGQGIHTAYTYIKPVIHGFCTAGKAVGNCAVAAWKNPYGKFVISAGAGVALCYAGYKNQELLSEWSNNAKDFTVSKSQELYGRIFPAQNNSQAVIDALSELPIPVTDVTSTQVVDALTK